MPKYLIRAVILLLLPCLVLDPITASGFCPTTRTQSLHTPDLSFSVNRFRQDACQFPILFVRRYLLRGSITAYHWAVENKKSFWPPLHGDPLFATDRRPYVSKVIEN